MDKRLRGRVYLQGRNLHRGGVALLAASLFAVGCHSPKSGRGPNSPAKTDLVVDTPTTIIGPSGVQTAEEVLDHAWSLVAKERYQEAATQFEMIVSAAQKKNERLRALSGLGTALDYGGRPETAVTVYARYLGESPQGPGRDEIAVRVVRLYSYLERYPDAAQVAQTLDLRRLSDEQQIAVLAALALDALQEGRLDDAELSIARARSIIEQKGYDKLQRLPLDVAAVYFALGRLRSKKAEAITFSPLPKDFLAALEERCQWILDAQTAYSSAMRAGDAHWSSMSGVSVSELYHHLHKDLTSIEAPTSAQTQEQKSLFEGAMRLRYSILLRKAVAMLEATVALQQRTGETGVWSKKAEDALLDMRRAKDREDAAIDALPYSRQQLQQGLDRLADQAETGAQNSGSEGGQK